MRNCPHCHKEIQDEATYCRFCRQDVDPPLWLASLQRCPFCAEWVERGIDRCPLCGKDLSTSQPFSIPTEEAEEASDLLSRLRSTALSTDDEPAAESMEDDYAPSVDIELEARADDLPTGKPSWFERMRKPPEPEERGEEDEEEGLGVLRGRRINLREELEPEPDQRPPVDLEVVREKRDLGEITGRILRWVLIVAISVVFIIVAILGYERITSASQASPRATRTDTPTPTQMEASATSAVPEATYDGTPGVLLPVTPSRPECVSWEEITLEMVGETACVYRELRRWFQVSDIPYVAIFSEVPGTFAFIDREQTYSKFAPGTCVTATGVIESMRATRPFIDVLQNLQECDFTP